MAYTTQIARCIRRARESTGLTRERLAERLRVSTDMVKRWETHDGAKRGKGISQSRAGEIAQALGYPGHFFDLAFHAEHQQDLPVTEATMAVTWQTHLASIADFDELKREWLAAHDNPSAVANAKRREEAGCLPVAPQEPDDN